MNQRKRLIIGISGASGIPLAVKLLEIMGHELDWETHLIISNGSIQTLEAESDYSLNELKALATEVHYLKNIGAAISSGTFKTEGMVVIPCSMKTLAGIAHGYSDNLLLRAADVVLKERRKLVLVTRETPLSHIHLTNMMTLSSYGAVIMPPMLTFYNKPKTIDDMIIHIVGKVLAEFGIEVNNFKRWKEISVEKQSNLYEV